MTRKNVILLANFYGAYVDETKFKSCVIVNNAGIEQLASMGVEEVKKYTDGTTKDPPVYVFFIAGLTDVLIKSEEQGKNRLELTPNSMQLIESKMEWASQVMTQAGATVIWSIMPPISLKMYHESEGWPLATRAYTQMASQIARDQHALNGLMFGYRKSAMMLNKKALGTGFPGPFFTDLVAEPKSRGGDDIKLNTKYFLSDGITPTEELRASWARQLNKTLDVISTHAKRNDPTPTKSSNPWSSDHRLADRGTKRTREPEQFTAKRADFGRKETEVKSLLDLPVARSTAMKSGPGAMGGNAVEVEKMVQLMANFQKHVGQQNQGVSQSGGSTTPEMQAIFQMFSALQGNNNPMMGGASNFGFNGPNPSPSTPFNNLNTMMQMMLQAKQKEQEEQQRRERDLLQQQQREAERKKRDREAEEKRSTENRKKREREAEERKKKEKELEEKRRLEREIRQQIESEQRERRRREEMERERRLKEEAEITKRRLEEAELTKRRLEDEARNLLEQARQREAERELYNLQQRAKTEMMLQQAISQNVTSPNDPFKSKKIPALTDIKVEKPVKSMFDRVSDRISSRPSTSDKSARPRRPDPRWEQPVILFSHVNSQGVTKPLRGIRGPLARADEKNILNQRLSQGVFAYELEGKPFPTLSLMRVKLAREGEMTTLETRVAEFNNDMMKLVRVRNNIIENAKNKKVEIEQEDNSHLHQKYSDRNISSAEARQLRERAAGTPKTKDDSFKSRLGSSSGKKETLSLSSAKKSDEKKDSRPRENGVRMKETASGKDNKSGSTSKDIRDKSSKTEEKLPAENEKPRWDKSDDEDQDEVELNWDSDNESVKIVQEETKGETSNSKETTKSSEECGEKTFVGGEEFVTIDETGGAGDENVADGDNNAKETTHEPGTTHDEAFLTIDETN